MDIWLSNPSPLPCPHGLWMTPFRNLYAQFEKSRLHDWIFILNINMPSTDFCNNTTYLKQLQKIRHVEKLFITYPVCLQIHNSFRRTIFKTYFIHILKNNEIKNLSHSM